MESISCLRCGSVDDYRVEISGPHHKAICNGCDRYIKFISQNNKTKTMLEKNNSATFLSIGDGKITKRVKQPTDQSVQRTLNNGSVIHEEIYDGVSGMITDIKTHEHPSFGKFWNVYLQDGEENYILQMNYSGGYASAFLKTLPNVDLTQRVRISPSMKIENDKKKVTLFIQQGGQALKHFYTKDNPNDLPQMTQKKIKGKLTWDDSDMMEFLEEMVKNDIVPKLKNVTVAAGEDDDEPF